MRTFFIYDSEYCKAEEDDPKDALLYFFSTQSYGSERYSLCCQIVGVAKFFKATFSCPSLIEMEKEKFVLHWAGKYLIVLGGTIDTHGNVLKRQLLYLCGLFCFYHGSFSNLFKACRNDKKEFLIKLELSWSRYLTFMQCFNNMLEVPVNALSLSFIKEYGDVINKSNQLLHMCQMSSSVVAGVVFSNNRVLSSQLTPEMSSYLTLMSNENAAFPVGNVTPSPKSLPSDVEMKHVYLNRKIIQSIVKYNHAYVGSSVRIKSNGKSQRSNNHYESASSGSEGDVDSGNCTEISQGKKEAESNVGRSRLFELNFKTQLLCCSMHSTIFKKDLLKSRNKTFLKYINSEYISEKLKIFKKKASTLLNSSAKSKRKQKTRNEISCTKKALSFNLLCHHHADVLSTCFISKSIYNHLNLSSTCDLEYSCYFCINNQFSSDLSPQSLKKWNSNMQIPDYLHHISLKPCVLEWNKEKHKAKKEKTSNYRVQVLKCRLRNSHCSQRGQTCLIHSNDRMIDFEATKSKPSKYLMYHLPQNLFNTERYWDNFDQNRLEKSVVFVQKCGTSMLVLLLTKNYDEKILPYLWNCGFSFLKDLEFQIDNKVEEGLDLMDPLHYILTYDTAHKVLKERPYNHGALFSEKYLKESVQAIQEDFQLHSKMQMMTILSANHFIYASQDKQKSGFYIQQDQNSRKLDTLVNLSKKANRRLEKYSKSSA